MSKSQPPRGSSLDRAVRKYAVSAFVAFTFAAYAFHVHLSNTGDSLSVASATVPNQNPVTLQLAQPTPAQPAMGPAAPANAQAAPTELAMAPAAPPTDVPSPVPSPLPLPSVVPSPALPRGQYRDGSYSGSVADAYYGNVQVQVTVQQGRITNVQMLEYPNDRRTSVRINNIAIPYLTSEALQAQSANVDLISGATLTSEAFAESLQSALSSAKA
jgi:uncharacterized protein with FMN-binding domain